MHVCTGKKDASEWRTILIELIEQIGWPNQTTLDSLEYQQVSQLTNVLDAVEINPALGYRIGITQFIQELESALKGVYFSLKLISTVSLSLRYRMPSDCLSMPYES